MLPTKLFQYFSYLIDVKGYSDEDLVNLNCDQLEELIEDKQDFISFIN